MVGWGCLALIQCATKNFGGLLAVRLILGTFEAGFFAGTVFYLTLFYNRSELGFRIAIFFGSALLASAFSGLISFGVFQINDPKVKGWQWLFIIEGSMTVLVAIAGFFWLPSRADQAWFLTDAEKTAAKNRMLRDSTKTINSKFSLKAAFATWSDWKFALAHHLLHISRSILNHQQFPSSNCWTTGLLDREDQSMDRCSQRCWLCDIALCCKVFRLFQGKDLSHNLLPLSIHDGYDHSGFD